MLPPRTHGAFCPRHHAAPEPVLTQPGRGVSARSAVCAEAQAAPQTVGSDRPGRGVCVTEPTLQRKQTENSGERGAFVPSGRGSSLL